MLRLFFREGGKLVVAIILAVLTVLVTYWGVMTTFARVLKSLQNL